MFFFFESQPNHIFSAAWLVVFFCLSCCSLTVLMDRLALEQSSCDGFSPSSPPLLEGYIPEISRGHVNWNGILSDQSCHLLITPFFDGQGPNIRPPPPGKNDPLNN